MHAEQLHTSQFESQEQAGDILWNSIQNTDFKELVKKDLQQVPENKRQKYMEIYQYIDTHILTIEKAGNSWKPWYAARKIGLA